MGIILLRTRILNRKLPILFQSHENRWRSRVPEATAPVCFSAVAWCLELPALRINMLKLFSRELTSLLSRFADPK